MFAPAGYMAFPALAGWSKEVARDLAWAKRTVSTEDGSTIVQVAGERDALECWSLTCLFENCDVQLCSPNGVLLSAPTIISMHLEQIEMLLPAIPFEESSLLHPEFAPGFEPGDHFYFRNRFAFFSWHTGCVDLTNARASNLIGNDGREENFSGAAEGYLVSRQALWIALMERFEGWAICLKEEALGDTLESLYEAFGVDEVLLEKLGLTESHYFGFLSNKRAGRPRKRDDALQARTHKTAPPVLPASVPSSPNPPINKGIESAYGHPIKEEFFNRIRPL